jgi:hypothetical protein
VFSAYIAASRRSDRSLEARIESARRASEIHKKRTGRALRVTEQDVINEEMYEEEDDDLQSQYRRLQAHLGNSADLFNGRLNAWVLSHYGTRQMAMAAQGGGMGFNPGMNMQPPNTPFFAYQPQQQPQSPTTTLAPGMTQRNQSYRQTPYPPQYHRTQDQRSQSLQDQQQQGLSEADIQTLQNQRRHSFATSPDEQSVPGTPQPQADMSRSPMLRNVSSSFMQPGQFGQSFFNDQFQNPGMNFNGFAGPASAFDPIMNQMQSPISPLTTSLPVEAQQVIGTSFDPNSQFTQMFMNQSHGQPVPAGINYTYRPNFGSAQMKPGSEGMNSTLSPNPISNIDTSVNNVATPALTHGSISSPDQVNPMYSAVNFDGFGLGVNFDKTPGGSNSAGTPADYFDDYVTTNDEIAQ